MAECPNKDCSNMVHKHDDSLYGEDGMHGIVKKLNCFVPKSWLWKFVSVFGVSLLVIGTYLYSSIASSDLKYAKAVDVERSKVSVAELKDTTARIEGRLDRIETKLTSMSNTNIRMQEKILQLLQQSKTRR